jgi:hypothetical protein
LIDLVDGCALSFDFFRGWSSANGERDGTKDGHVRLTSLLVVYVS